MTTTEEQIFEDLKQVIDPELFVNIVDLGLIYSVDLAPVEDEQLNVKIDMTLTSPMCPAGPQLVGPFVCADVPVKSALMESPSIVSLSLTTKGSGLDPSLSIYPSEK